MSLFEQIRRVHAAEPGVSIRELSRRFRVHRRDVRAALESPLPPPRKTLPAKAAPKLDVWKPMILSWLEADRDLPKKQRHTARRVWQRLVEEHGADVGESTVRRFVKQVRDSFETPLAEVSVPQDHLLGVEAEVDFGEVKVFLGGVMVSVAMFVMRLSASGRSFSRVYMSEAQESFLDGHVQGFNHFGGVPVVIRYDNLKAAVTKVLKGRDRQESERFIALRSHYRFDSFFCEPGIKGAHEKGGVEGEVGRFRRRHLVPIPRVDTLAELNDLIMAGCLIDDGRVIAHRRMTVGAHFALEQPTLAALPVEPFDAVALSQHRVDTKARVSVRSAHYSVPARLVRQRLDVLVRADTIDIYNGADRVATHARGRRGDQVLDLDHYLDVLVFKPGALPGSTALAAAKTSGAFTPAHQQFWATARRRLGDRDGTRALIGVLLLHRTIDPNAVVAGIGRALKVDSVDHEVVAVEARRHLDNIADPPLATVTPIVQTERPQPSLDRYDQLLENHQ